jgi:hypothetical protein
MYPMTVYVGQARLAELHEEAQRDALARAARQARRAQRLQSGHHSPGLRAAVTHWARRPGPAPEGLC